MGGASISLVLPYDGIAQEMNVSRFTKRVQKKVKDHGIHGIAWSLLVIYRQFVVQQYSAHPFNLRGTNIYEKDWDMLVILDACRLDLLQEVASEYEFIENIESIYSMGTHSEGWVERTFTEEHNVEMHNTGYISANPHSNNLDSNQFHTLVDVWKNEFNEDLGTIPARSVTDVAIDVHRAHSPDRLLVHYMQPHFPSVPQEGLGSKLPDNENHLQAEWSDSIWTRLEDGKVSEEEVWEGYKENLRYVLDDVRILLENVNAENAVITSDHGNAFGEYGFYGHPRDTPIRQLREVPWIETTAQDTRSYLPKTNLSQTETDLEEQLRALGYRSE